MKKTGFISAASLLVAFFAMSAVCAPLFAQGEDGSGPAEYAPLVFSAKSGEYVYYRQTRSDGVSYIGLCVLGKNKLAVRLYEPELGNDLVVLETFYTTGDKYAQGGLTAEEGTIDLIRGDFGQGGSSRVLSTVLEWADAWVKARPAYGSDVGVPAGFRGGLDGSYVFQSRIPVLQLREANVSEDGTGLRLVKVGYVESGTDPAFFNWDGSEADPLVFSEMAAD